MVIEGFGQSCVVDFLREVLESGFQSALINFPAVQALLEVDFMTSESVVSKGVKTSKSSAKQRTLDRQRDRGYCDIYSMDFQGDESS